VKTSRQHPFDAVHFHGDGTLRHADQLADCLCVHAFQIAEHHLTIERGELLNERPQPPDLQPAIEAVRGLGWIRRGRIELVQRDELMASKPEHPGNVCGGGVVGDAIDPRPQGAAPIERRQTPPNREVDVLEQIPEFVGIGFVSVREPLDRGAKRVENLMIEDLASGPARGGLGSRHIQVVGRRPIFSLMERT